MNHSAPQDVALADEVRHKGVGRLVVDGLGVADLQNPAVPHDHDGVAHGQGFLLVVGDVEEGDAQPLLHVLQFKLHLLAQLQIQRAQGLVQQQHLRLVDQAAGDGHALLLSAGEGVHMALAVTAQVHQIQHGVHLAVDLCLGYLF